MIVAGMRAAFNAKGVHTYGCQAHILNLLAKDIALNNNNKAVNAKITSIIKFLRNTHSASSALKAKKLPRPPLYTETRWNSLKETLQYFTHHWSDIAVIANANLKPRDQVYRYMEEVSIKRAATDQLAILEPLSSALNTVQGDKCLLGDVYEIWRNLKNSIPDEYQADVASREHQSLSGVFFAANLLDPRYRGQHFCAAEVQAAVAYIQEKDEEIGEELTKYLANHPPYLDSIFGNVTATTTPGSWWKAGIRVGFDSRLADMAESLVSASPSSASLERHFSTMGMTYGTLRSRLGVDKARKLSFLYRQLNK